MTGVVRSLPILGLVTVAACSSVGDAGDGPPTTVRDSAGVRIVENSVRDMPERLLPDAPVFDLGAASDDVELYEVAGATRLPDRRVVIANGGTHEILLVDAAGRLIEKLGREGDGPGEFRSLGWIDQLGRDSLIVYDERLRRLSTLTAGGEFVESVRPEPAAAAFFPEFFGLLSDGTLLALIGEPFSDDRGGTEVRYRDSLTVLRYGGDGRLLDTLGRFPNQEAFYVRSPNGDLAWSRLPFGLSTALATGAEEVHVVTGDAYEVQSYDPAGRLIRLTRLGRLRPEVATEDRDAFLRQRREHVSAIDDPARRRLHQSLLERIPFPERHAGYVDLAVSATGEVWAQRDSVTWDVFAEDGTLLEVRRLPSGIEVFEIGVDYLLGMEGRTRRRACRPLCAGGRR